MRTTTAARARLTALIGVIVGLALLGATTATADPAPVTGQTSGGTPISGEVSTIGFSEIATSVVGSGSAATFGLGTDGRVYAWGSNTFGQLGNGTVGGSALTPAAVSLPTEAIPVTRIAAGFLGGFALGADGNVYAWGSNTSGQVGNGTSGGSQPLPVKVSIPPAALPVSQIAGYAGGYAMGADGNVYAWGQNTNGQIGNGTSGAALVTIPVRVNLPAPALPVKQVSADGNSAFVLGADGAVYGWGDNTSRQLGNNSSAASFPSPVPVSLPPAAIPAARVVGTAIGAYALGADGNVYSWGANSQGQAGNGTTSVNVPVPVTVSLPVAARPATKVGGSGSTGYAVGADGNVYAWGLNSNGQLGNGALGSVSTPVLVSVPPDAKPVAEVNGGYTGYLLNTDGALFAWGLNTSGQIGNGTSGANVTTPVRVPLAVVTSVTVGGVPATDLTQTPTVSGGEPVISWTAITPPGCGPTDVAVAWTQTSVPLTQTFADGFTYGSAPVFDAQPASATISAGDDFTATVTATGDSAPIVQWQQEGPAGTWTNVPGQTSSVLDVASVMETTTYRAVATNCWGADAAAISETATVLVRDAFTVTFDANGGDGTMAPQTADAPAALFPNAFARAGFAFAGWNTNADGSGDEVSDGATFAFDEDLTLFAQWDAAASNLTAVIGDVEVRQGAMQNVVGGGFAPGERVSAVMKSDLPLSIGSAVAGSDGTVRFEWRIPAEASLGPHTVDLTGQASGSVAASFSVVSSGSEIAATGGSDLRPLAVTGAAALLLGTVLLIWRRRQA